MNSRCVVVWVLTIAGTLVLGGCNGPATETAELQKQVEQLKTSLDETCQERDRLQEDVKAFEESLTKAESALADEKKEKGELGDQVESLARLRDELEAKVGILSDNGAKLETKVDELGAARAELSRKVDELSTAKGQLQRRVDELTKSRDELQTMVENLVDTRGLLEKQVATLTKMRDSALADAKIAQTQIEQLNSKLQVQTEQMMGLQTQIKAIRSVLQQLQQKLE